MDTGIKGNIRGMDLTEVMVRGRLITASTASKRHKDTVSSTANKRRKDTVSSTANKRRKDTVSSTANKRRKDTVSSTDNNTGNKCRRSSNTASLRVVMANNIPHKDPPVTRIIQVMALTAPASTASLRDTEPELQRLRLLLGGHPRVSATGLRRPSLTRLSPKPRTALLQGTEALDHQRPYPVTWNKAPAAKFIGMAGNR
jgi:hypothetical protein